MAMTLEQYGQTVAQQMGYDPSDPKTQEEINRTIKIVRDDAPPGATDEQLIQGLQEQLPRVGSVMGATIAKRSGFEGDPTERLNQMYNVFNTAYSPERKAEVEQAAQGRAREIETGRSWGDAFGGIAGAGYLTPEQQMSLRTERGAGAETAINRSRDETVGAFERESQQAEKALTRGTQQIEAGQRAEVFKREQDAYQQEQNKQRDRKDPNSQISIMSREALKTTLEQFPTLKGRFTNIDELSAAQIEQLSPAFKVLTENVNKQLEAQFKRDKADRDYQLQQDRLQMQQAQGLARIAQAEASAQARLSREAASAATAAAKAEVAQAKAGAPERAKMQDAEDTLELLRIAEPLLSGATGSGIGAAVDRGLAIFGSSTEGGDKAAQLASIGGLLIAKQPKMSGPQSDRDVMLYREMAGKIGDPSVPASQKQAALQIIRQMNEKYASTGTLGDRAGTPTTPKAGGATSGWSAKER